VRSHPNYLSAVLLGGSIALAALTRGEAITLVVFLTVPITLMMRNLAWSKRLLLLLVALLATGAVIAPWTIRNLTTFKEPVLVSSNGDAVLAFANCDQVYSGPFIGFWYHRCPKTYPTGDESQIARPTRHGFALHQVASQRGAECRGGAGGAHLGGVPADPDRHVQHR
jgi:hypothetical protein